MEQTATSDLYLDRNREVWRRVHDGSLMRLSLGGYISPAHPFDMVELRWGPLRELAPIERGTHRVETGVGVMSENFPGNPWADVHSEVKPDAAGIMSSLHLLAYEQRTATLVNLYAAQIQSNRPVPFGLRKQIDDRLGDPLNLGDE